VVNTKLNSFGAISTNMNKMVWKNLATPQTKFLAWLTHQVTLWTVDRFEKREWTNCELCPVCKKNGLQRISLCNAVSAIGIGPWKELPWALLSLPPPLVNNLSIMVV
jgi:hypothetical protein